MQKMIPVYILNVYCIHKQKNIHIYGQSTVSIFWGLSYTEDTEVIKFKNKLSTIPNHAKHDHKYATNNNIYVNKKMVQLVFLFMHYKYE